jgi:hypothetical protein
MVRLDYLSKNETDEKDEILKKREDVKGLAKKFFGFWRVGNSLIDECLVLNSFFNLNLNVDIGTINTKTDSMYLFKKDYQKKAENFAEDYQKQFMDCEKEFIINLDYSE